MKALWYRLNTKERRLLIVLLVILVYGVLDFAMNYDDYQAALSGDEPYDIADFWDSTGTANAVVDSLPKTHWQLSREWTVDPFRLSSRKESVVQPVMATPVTTGNSNPTIVIQAISISGPHRLALINGQVVKEGDWLGGYRVKTITENGVTLVNKTGYIKQILVNALRGKP